jgi:hypothetical protein
MDITLFVILLGILLYNLLKEEKDEVFLDNDLWGKDVLMQSSS